MIPEAARKYVYYEEPDITLLHGDCLEILPLLEPGSVDLVLTDPPYGINIAKTGTVGVQVKAELKQYEASEWDSSAPSREVFDLIRSIGKIQIIWGGNYFADKLPTSKCWLCWDKQIPKGYSKAQIELAWTNATTYSRHYSVLWHGMIRERRHSEEERWHPTQKPLSLMEYVLRDFEGDLILDPFGGSGTTAIAAKQLGRKCIIIELEAKYLDITIERLRQEVLF